MKAVPLGQTANLDGKLLEGIWQPRLECITFISVFLCCKHVVIGVAILAFRPQLELQRVKDVGDRNGGALDSASSTAGQGPFGRLEAGEGFGRLQVLRSVGHGVWKLRDAGDGWEKGRVSSSETLMMRRCRASSNPKRHADDDVARRMSLAVGAPN